MGVWGRNVCSVCVCAVVQAVGWGWWGGSVGGRKETVVGQRQACVVVRGSWG